MFGHKDDIESITGHKQAIKSNSKRAREKAAKDISLTPLAKITHPIAVIESFKGSMAIHSVKTIKKKMQRCDERLHDIQMAENYRRATSAGYDPVASAFQGYLDNARRASVEQLKRKCVKQMQRKENYLERNKRFGRSLSKMGSMVRKAADTHSRQAVYKDSVSGESQGVRGFDLPGFASDGYMDDVDYSL